jgi:DHA1 family bicyclomycin/chloramphenicol resistance-like MFS transporter
MFLYVLAAPAFLGEHLHLQPTQFFWFFVLTISGIMSGAWLSGRLAGKIAPKVQIRHGFVIMLTVSVVNLVANYFFKAHVSWALIPIALFAFGWALMVPVITLLVLDLYPERRGMASSLQAVIGSTANGLVAGLLTPLVMHSTLALATASVCMMGIGLIAWLYLHKRFPEIGRNVQNEEVLVPRA